MAILKKINSQKIIKSKKNKKITFCCVETKKVYF